MSECINIASNVCNCTVSLVLGQNNFAIMYGDHVFWGQSYDVELVHSLCES